MGFRFQKRIKIFPGLTVNLGKRGISSWSIGRKGARLNFGKRGVKSTVGIPGTGLSHSSTISREPGNQNAETSESKGCSFFGCALLLIAIGVVAVVVCGLVGLFFGRDKSEVPATAGVQESSPANAKPRFASPLEAQKEAVRQHPELGKAGSPFNVAFLAKEKRLRSEKPEFFKDNAWPVVLADEVAKVSRQ